MGNYVKQPNFKPSSHENVPIGFLSLHETGPILIETPWPSPWSMASGLAAANATLPGDPVEASAANAHQLQRPDQRRCCPAGFGPFGGASRWKDVELQEVWSVWHIERYILYCN